MERFKIDGLSPGSMNTIRQYDGAPQKPKTKPFFLEDHLPPKCDAVTIIKAAGALYPNEIILQEPQLVLPYLGEPYVQRQVSR